MKAHIREYTAIDKAACLEAFKSNVPLFFTKDEIDEFTSFLDHLPVTRINDRTYFYVVVSGNKITGCGGFGDRDGNGTVTLAWGLVHRDFHKKGIGKLLLDYRLDELARLYPLNPVYLDTTQFSYGFFEKSGFKVTKITDDYYTKGMHRYDMIRDQSTISK